MHRNGMYATADRMPTPVRSPVKAVCGRCGAGLVRGFSGRLRCPRLSACGYGGLVEDRATLELFRLTKAFERGFTFRVAPPLTPGFYPTDRPAVA